MSLGGILRVGGAGEATRPITGLRGLASEVDGNLSVKVTDYKGRELQDVKITTSQGKVFYTDGLGNAFIAVEGTNVQLTLSKYRYKRKYSVPDGVAQVSFQFSKPLPR